MRSIYRYSIPADDQPHDYALSYDPLPVLGLTAERAVLDFWAEYDSARETYQVRLQIVGTGRRLPDRAVWIATAPRNQWGEVAHLVQLPTKETTMNPGDRVRLLHCDDPDAPPPGTQGTVLLTNDRGTVHVKWDNGTQLGMIARAGDRIELVQ